MTLLLAQRIHRRSSPAIGRHAAAAHRPSAGAHRAPRATATATGPLPLRGSRAADDPHPTVGRVSYASDPRRDLSATPATPIGDVDGVGDRPTTLSMA
jgi:hypothetical protein